MIERDPVSQKVRDLLRKCENRETFVGYGEESRNRSQLFKYITNSFIFVSRLSKVNKGRVDNYR